jgi:hypothetical protein
VAGDCTNAYDSPFGGSFNLEGDFSAKLNVFDPVTGVVLPGAKPVIYQVWITPPSPGVPFQLTNPF